MSEFSTDAVRDALAADGVDVGHLERVSQSVWRLTTGLRSRETRYVKFVPSEQAGDFQTVAELGPEIGAPDGHVVTADEFSLYLMTPAEGTMLSYTLPKYLLPGVWHRRGDDLLSGITKLGEYVGTLHERTRRNTATVGVDSLHLDKFDAVVDGQLNDRLHEILDEQVTADAQRIIDRHPSLELDRSLVHGDLILRHAFYANGDVTLIDFDRMAVAGSLEDCVSFLCTLELMIRRLPYARRRQFERLRDRFCDGYGDDLHSRQVEILSLVKYCSLLLYYARKTEPIWTNPSFALPQLTRDVDVFVLKRRIRRSVDDPPQ